MGATLHTCPELCQQAFTEVEGDQGLEGSSSIYGSIRGPNLNAITMSERQANLMCSRFQDTYQIGMDLVASHSRIFVTESDISRRLHESTLYPRSNIEQTRQLTQIFADARYLLRDLQASDDFNIQLRSLRQYETQLRSLISSYCSGRHHSSWNRLCELNGAPVLDRITRMKGYIEQLLQRNNNQASMGRARLEMIQLFYSHNQ